MAQLLARNSNPTAPPPVLDYENRGNQIMGVCIAATVVIGIIVPLRLWVRTTVVKWIGWDDWTMVAAAVISITLNAIAMESVHFGAGRHVTTIPPHDFKEGMKLNLITQMLNLLATLCVKVSICLFLARLAPTLTYKRITYGTAIFMTIYSIACVFSVAFQCVPMQKIWDRFGVEGTCISIQALLGLSYTYAAINILTDFFLVILPVPMIWTVKIPMRQKILITLVLALGLFAAAAGVVKLRFLVDYGKTGDFLWDSVDLTVWSVVEVNVGIVCASMPALKPLFKRFLEKTGFSTGSKGKQSHSGEQPSNNSHPLQSLSKSTVSAGVRRVHTTKQTTKNGNNDSEESIFARAEQDLGIHITENRSSGSLEEGYIR